MLLQSLQFPSLDVIDFCADALPFLCGGEVLGVTFFHEVVGVSEGFYAVDGDVSVELELQESPAVQCRSETKKRSRFAEWLENNAEESMTYFNFDEGWCCLVLESVNLFELCAPFPKNASFELAAA